MTVKELASQAATVPNAIITINESLPSLNTYIGLCRASRRHAAKFEEKWKATGHQAAHLWILQEHGNKFKPLGIGSNVKIEVKIWRPNNIRRDLDNTYIKPILDGFKAVGLLADDNEKIVTKISFECLGLDKARPRVEFHLYWLQVNNNDEDKQNATI